MRRALTVLGVLVAVVATLGLAWLAGMRDKNSSVVAAQRRINRRVFNPRQMQTAGTPGAYSAIIRHTGRTSGRTYETPVGVEQTADGFAIALVYGRQSDWVRNVLAAGTATVVHEGSSYTVNRPEVVPLDELPEVFPPDALRSMRVFGVKDSLRLHVAGAGAAV